MKCFVFLTSLALASAFSLGPINPYSQWQQTTLQGVLGGPIAQQTQIQEAFKTGLGLQTVAKTLSDQIEFTLQQAKVQNAIQKQQQGSWSSKSVIAEETAQKILQQIDEAKQTEIVEDIKELEQELQLKQFQQSTAQTMGQQIVKQASKEAIIEAIQQLEKALQKTQQTQLTGESFQTKEQLKDTLKTVIEAQFVVESSETGLGPLTTTSSGQKSGVFQNKVKKTVAKYIVEEIKKKISKKQKTIQQLEQQKQLVQEKKQQIQLQIEAGKLQGSLFQPVQELVQTKQKLDLQRKELAKKQAGGELVVKKLLEDLIEQQEEVEKEAILEEVKESGGQGLVTAGFL